MKKYRSTIIKIAVSIGLYALLFSQVDIGEVIDSIKLVNPMYVPLIIGLLILNYLVSAVRWKKLLIFENTEHVKTTYLARLYFIGAFFNNFLPTSIGGDSYKIYKLAKKINSVTHAFISTFMERFTGVIALVLISYVGLAMTWDMWVSLLPAEYANSPLISWFKFMLFFGFWILMVMGFVSLKLVAAKSVKVQKFYNALISYKNERGVLIWAFLTSFIVQLIAIATQYFVFKALGVDLPISYSLFVFPVITLASFFIPSLNGVGVQDLLYVQLFQPVGVSSAMALSASILYHLFRMLVSLIGGVFYALDRDS